jgi:hypothetical protein
VRRHWSVQLDFPPYSLLPICCCYCYLCLHPTPKHATSVASSQDCRSCFPHQSLWPILMAVAPVLPDFFRSSPAPPPLPPSHLRLTEQNTELTELMASGHTLAPAAVGAFASLLEKNNRIVKFGVGNEALGDDGVCGLAPGIAKSRSVVHLEMDMKGMGTRGCEALAKALEDNRSVKRLNLARNKIGDAGLRAIAQGLAANGEESR